MPVIAVNQSLIQRIVSENRQMPCKPVKRPAGHLSHSEQVKNKLAEQFKAIITDPEFKKNMDSVSVNIEY
ncbi:hypothetical protein [Sporomusa sp.]|jgi:hypothetical protein|uniref:hypothetical protein n=1 Tax=Sporomusa sp. TaxID=2078658 RepID=UPI002C3B9E24|nr:hypothetical protein [Sporomusa sp.]HWR08490.1 hypothetical protein [Sporomusa sp.]